MDGEQFAYALRRRRASVRRGLYRADVAAHHDGHKSAAHLYLAEG